MPGELPTHYSIRLALICLAVRCFWQLRYWGQQPAPFTYCMRGIWTLGCLAFLVHVTCAFHYYHHWQPAAAYAETAKRTQEMLGVAFGAGIYFSYLFGVLWLADVLRLWRSPLSATAFQNRGEVMLLIYMVFISFNGAVVFEAGVTRWLGLPVSALLLGMIVLAGRRPAISEGHA